MPTTHTDAAQLGYGVLAVALYASSMPTGARQSATTLTSYADEGLRMLGGLAEAHKLHNYLRHLNEALLTSHISEEDYHHDVAAQWDDPKRLEYCLDLDLARCTDLLSHHSHATGSPASNQVSATT